MVPTFKLDLSMKVVQLAHRPNFLMLLPKGLKHIFRNPFNPK